MHPWRNNPNKAWPERKWLRCVTSDTSPMTVYNFRLEMLFPFVSQQREKIIFDHFSDPVFINQFIEFLSLEDRKGKDKFSPRRFCLFKVRFVGVGVLKRKMLQIGKKKNLFLALIGIVPKFQRRLCSCAPTTHGAPGGWHAREQAALRVRDHLWADSRVQALELLKGMCEPNKQSFLSHEKYPEILCFTFKLFLAVT